MADIVFKQPPLVEIAAEFRWDIPGLQVPEQFAGAPMPLMDGTVHEIQFMNFASKAGAKGYGLIERVVPTGFPLLAGQATFRYRNAIAVEGAPVFQLGPGVFSVNLVPPYKSWESFLPYIDLGLGLLFDSRSQEQQVPFSEVRLGYIDAFGDNLRRGQSVVKFLAQNLGVTVQLPPSIMQFCTDQDGAKVNLAVSLPISTGTLNLSIAEGWVRNARSLIMNTTVVHKGPLTPDKAAIVAAMNAAHKVIHDSFVGMTGPLHQLMEPVTGG
jgi:uncharacterized protein (TIGR04255 family)